MGTLVVVKNIKNTNSGFKLVSFNERVEVTEYSESYLSFQLTKDNFVPGLLISMDVVVTINGVNREFAATGKIVSVEEAQMNLVSIRIHLHQFDKPIWTSFLALAKDNQKHIDTLLAKMKGEDA